MAVNDVSFEIINVLSREGGQEEAKENDKAVFSRELHRVTEGEIPKVVFRLAFIVRSTG